MKIIFIAKCIDNKDPRGFGRIRVEFIDELASSRSRAINNGNYQQWSKQDPFICSPFLPNHINIVPQIGQAVKIIRYDLTKDLQNQEYITGPYTTSFNFENQTFSQQISETTYGVSSEKTPDIKSFDETKKVFDDNFVRAESVGSLPKINDVAISGNYGSDIILSEHGVQLRAGKLIDKIVNSAKEKKELEKYPIYSNKQARLSLKKFPETHKLDYKTIESEVTSVSQIRYVFEYDLDDAIDPTELNFYLYRIDSTDSKYNTENFNIETPLTGGTLVYNETFVLTKTNKIQEAYLKTRNFLYNLDKLKLNEISSDLTNENAHPFYYKPKDNLRNLSNSIEFLKKIKIYNNSSNIGYGLILNTFIHKAIPTTEIKVIPYIKKVNSEHQSFASLVADNIMYLSTDKNGTGDKKIDFNSLNRYEYTQEDYLERIIPNTFSTVRGEKLIEILDLIVLILLNHTHGIVTTPIYTKEVTENLQTLIAKAKTDMINNSIRIN